MAKGLGLGSKVSFGPTSVVVSTHPLRTLENLTGRRQHFHSSGEASADCYTPCSRTRISTIAPDTAETASVTLILLQRLQPFLLTTV